MSSHNRAKRDCGLLVLLLNLYCAAIGKAFSTLKLADYLEEDAQTVVV